MNEKVRVSGVINHNLERRTSLFLAMVWYLKILPNQNIWDVWKDMETFKKIYHALFAKGFVWAEYSND